MGSFLITLAFATVIIVTGVIVNWYLYHPGAKRYKRSSRGLKPVSSRYTTREAMSDVEYYTRLPSMYEEGPRYARRVVMGFVILVILIVIFGISLLSGLH